jgi:F-type H+-transporting ATPase subunit gamma
VGGIVSSKNACRLKAIQLAEKSIGDTLENFGKKFQNLRQSMIHEEHFDVISEFEILKKNSDR